MKLLLLVCLAAIVSNYTMDSKPLPKPVNTTPEHCDSFTFGDTEKLRRRCIQNAKADTLGMYLNLVQTVQTPDGPITFAIDRPNKHGPIYDMSKVDKDHTVTISTPQGSISVNVGESFLSEAPYAEDAATSD